MDVERKKPRTPHYFVSITIVDTKDLTRVEGKPLIFYSLGINKHSTQTPALCDWKSNERLELATTKCPEFATVRCVASRKGGRGRSTIGEVKIDLQSAWNRAPRSTWYVLYDVSPQPPMLGDGPRSRGRVRLQLSARHIPVEERHRASWTDLMQMNVQTAEHLPFFARGSSSACSLFTWVQWGLQGFKTSRAYVSVTQPEPHWRHAGFIFLDRHAVKVKTKFVLFCCRKDNLERIGTGFLDIGDIMDSNRPDFQKKVQMFAEDNPDFDGNIRLPESHAVCQLAIAGRVTSRAELEQRLVDGVMMEFDANMDGTLDRAEAFEMVHTLSADFDTSMFDSWFDLIDTNEDDRIEASEVANFLKSSEFQSNMFIDTIVSASLCARPSAISANILSGVLYPSGDNVYTREVCARDTGNFIEEDIPHYISMAQKLIANNPLGGKLSSPASSFQESVSIRLGRKFDHKGSATEIRPFIALHNIDVSELKKSPDAFECFNDFFARELTPESRPIASPNDPSVLVSPCDGRMVVFNSINEAARFWIKGQNFSMETLLGPLADKYAKQFWNCSMVMCRLAPKDYHRWHMPASCIHGRVTHIDGTLNTVSPHTLNDPESNVLSDNKRCVVELLTKDFGTILMVIVGGFMVGSYRVYGEPMQSWRKGTVHGEFRFGGSTVLLLFREGRVTFDEDLVRTSKESVEMLVRANSKIG
eukprot:271369_1